MNAPRLLLSAVLMLASSAPAGQLRIAAAHGSGITGVNPEGPALVWTNHATGDFEIEQADPAGETWRPLVIGTSSQSVETTRFPVDRTYHLGFTPFPYGLGSNVTETLAIISNVYRVVREDGDIISHHFDSGVPWPEALAGQPFPVAMVNDLEFRTLNTPPGHATLLTITPIDITRTTLAPYRGAQESLPLPPPWDTYTFNHPDVKEAYYHYAKRMIEWFDPAYTVIGIEVNLLMDLAPASWPAYRELHTGTYARLKIDFPEKPIAVTWTGMDLLDGYTSALHTQQLAALHSLTGHTDFFGLSLHSFISALTAETVAPVSLLNQLFDLVDQPLALCETSYPAQPISLLGGSLVFNGSPEKQTRFFHHLFAALEDRDARLVVNFIAIDYDQLWNEMGQPDDINKLWRDTGLYDENQTPRPALRPWQARLSLPRR